MTKTNQMPTTDQCKNCEKIFDASFDYCPHCGQETADNLTFGVLFSNTISNYFSIDARFLKSFVPLMIKPGVLARRFVDGKRLSYLHPAQFYLFISVIFFFVFSFSVRKADSDLSKVIEKGLSSEVSFDSIALSTDSIQKVQAQKVLEENKKYLRFSDQEMEVLDSIIAGETPKVNSEVDFNRKKLDSLIEIGAPIAEKLQAMGMGKNPGAFKERFYTQLLKFYEKRGGGILQALYDTIPIAMFLMLPLFAVLLKIFYWKRATFAHHMVFSFYFFTFIFAALSTLILINFVIDIPFGLEFLIWFSFVFYLVIALRNFYKSSWFGSFAKAGAISFIYTLLIVPIAILGIALVSFMLY